MKSFIQRAITGVLFVAVLIGGILYHPLSFAILFAVIIALAINEFCNLMNKQEGVSMNKPISILGGLFLFFAFFYYEINPESTAIFIPYLAILLYLMISELYLKKINPLHNWAYACMSQLYIALPLSMLNVLAFQNPGEYNAILPLSIFIFLWANDTGAYCVGVLIGKHRLFPRISPKKSWEGSVGGSVVSIAAAIALAQFQPDISVSVWIGYALVVVVFGTWGDLTESLLKRTIQVKDSGNILPGHGGILDRFDSSLMAIPAVVTYFYLVSLLA